MATELVQRQQLGAQCTEDSGDGGVLQEERSSAPSHHAGGNPSGLRGVLPLPRPDRLQDLKWELNIMVALKEGLTGDVLPPAV